MPWAEQGPGLQQFVAVWQPVVVQHCGWRGELLKYKSTTSSSRQRGAAAATMPPIVALTKLAATAANGNGYPAGDKRSSRGESLGQTYRRLGDLSAWLSSFRSANFSREEAILVPGESERCAAEQGGDGGASLEGAIQAPHIVSFGDGLLTLSSMQKPKRVSMLGSDEGRRFFLAKGGEDIRLDQRVQRLFQRMRGALRADRQAAQAGLDALITYDVVPLSTEIGLLEWVSNCATLRDTVHHHANAEGWGGTSGKFESMSRSSPGLALHWALLERHGGSGAALVTKYLGVIEQAPMEDLVATQLAAEARSPHNALVREAQLACPDLEAHMTWRSQMVRSTAALTLCGYLLGIGDRHLDNFLISRKDGRLVAIDFGHAFGSATFLLPVPELIPMRMTPLLLASCWPGDGLLMMRTLMVRALGALRRSAPELLAALEVFASDPLVDWMQPQQKWRDHMKVDGVAGSGDASSATDGADEGAAAEDDAALLQSARLAEGRRQARQRIQSAHLKLAGAHPADLVLRDLLANSNVRKVGGDRCGRRAEALLRGIPGRNPRADPKRLRPRAGQAAEAGALPQLRRGGSTSSSLSRGRASLWQKPAAEAAAALEPRYCVDVDSQVLCLLDLATDPAVAAGGWQGLNLWI